MNVEDKAKVQAFSEAVSQSFEIKEARTPANQINFGIVEVTDGLKLKLGLISSEGLSHDYQRPGLN